VGVFSCFSLLFVHESAVVLVAGHLVIDHNAQDVFSMFLQSPPLRDPRTNAFLYRALCIFPVFSPGFLGCGQSLLFASFLSVEEVVISLFFIPPFFCLLLQCTTTLLVSVSLPLPGRSPPNPLFCTHEVCTSDQDFQIPSWLPRIGSAFRFPGKAAFFLFFRHFFFS